MKNLNFCFVVSKTPTFEKFLNKGFKIKTKNKYKDYKFFLQLNVGVFIYNIEISNLGIRWNVIRYIKQQYSEKLIYDFNGKFQNKIRINKDHSPHLNYIIEVDKLLKNVYNEIMYDIQIHNIKL